MYMVLKLDKRISLKRRLFLPVACLLVAFALACSHSGEPSSVSPAAPDVAPTGTSPAAAPPAASTATQPSATGTPDRIRLVTNTSHQTYAVYGSTADEILGYIGS